MQPDASHAARPTKRTRTHNRCDTPPATIRGGTRSHAAQLGRHHALTGPRAASSTRLRYFAISRLDQCDSPDPAGGLCFGNATMRDRAAGGICFQTFRELRECLGWTAEGRTRRPCIHDLRHTFAVRRLLAWYASGVDIDRKMLALSTYLGHAGVEHTYWYLQAVPELMAITAERFEHFAREHQQQGGVS